MTLRPRLIAIAIGLALPAAPGFSATPAPAVAGTAICSDAETASAPDEDYIASCSEIIRKADGDARVLSNAFRSRAMAYHRMGQYEQAVDDLDHAISLDAENASAWNDRCFDNAVLRRIEPALVDCRKALALSPDYAVAWSSLGFARLVQGKDDAALGAYDRALSLAPELPEALFGRGVAKERLGDQKGAAADLAAATSLQPEVAGIFARFGISPSGASAAAPAGDAAPDITVRY
jgi:tetratricopeptide (TPR) repeat protein